MGQRPGRAGLAARLAAVLLSATGALSEALPPLAAGDEEGSGSASGDGGKPGSKAASEAATAPPPRNEALANALAGSGAWAAATSPGGVLSALLSEQRGELCGPRPARLEAMSEEGGEVGDALGGGSVISGEQLLAMLQDISSRV
jgi:hypothetical protein